MSFPEAQGYLKIRSRKTLLKYVRAGRLPALKIGGTRWRIFRKDAEAFLHNRENQVFADIPHSI